MDMIDTKKLDNAIIYLQRITEGHNPVNNLPVDEDSVINDPNVIRCMFFIKDTLEKIRKNEGYIGRIPKRVREENNKPDYPIEKLKDFHYTGEKSITKIVEQLNGLVDIGECKKLTYEPITKWLKQNGYLKEDISPEFGRKSSVPTEKGLEIGIKAEKREKENGYAYMYVTYGKQAQELIVSNLAKILGINP